MKLRASLLPGYNDCPRRSAARQFPELLLQYGIALKATLPSIGAAVGTATHAVVEEFYKAKIDGREFDRAAAIDGALEGLAQEVAPGAQFDDTTPSTDVARAQVGSMADAYIGRIGRNMDALAVEQSLVADLGDGWVLTGHIDLVARTDRGVGIRDLKTGAISRSYHAQLGAYSLLYRSAQDACEVTELAIDFVKRVPRSRAQVEPVSTHYDPQLCEREAYATIGRVMRDVTEYERTGDINAFAANPMSLMCSALYCPAHGSDFCPLTKP